MLLGMFMILLATATAVFLGWLGNRGVQSFHEDHHVSFADLSTARGEGRKRA